MDEDRRRWFAAQVERLTDRLYGTALRLTRKPEDAEDLVAETVIKAWGPAGRAARRAGFPGVDTAHPEQHLRERVAPPARQSGDRRRGALRRRRGRAVLAFREAASAVPPVVERSGGKPDHRPAARGPGPLSPLRELVQDFMKQQDLVEGVVITGASVMHEEIKKGAATLSF